MFSLNAFEMNDSPINFTKFVTTNLIYFTHMFYMNVLIFLIELRMGTPQGPHMLQLIDINHHLREMTLRSSLSLIMENRIIWLRNARAGLNLLALMHKLT